MRRKEDEGKDEKSIRERENHMGVWGWEENMMLV